VTLRKIFLRHQVTQFVMLFVERSGSTYLTTLLNSHPDILAQGEKLDILKQKGHNAQTQLKWTREFLTPPLIGRNKARGYKTKLKDVLDQDGFAQLIQEMNCKIIQLRRHNSVKAVISTINARRLWEASGNWNLINDDSSRMPAFAVDPDEFANLLQQRKSWDEELEAYVQRLQLPTLALYYEDLLKDEPTFIQNVYSFLEVKPKPAQGITLKHTSDDLRDVIVNFDELYVRYTGTPYQPMFDEVLC
jgi:LPS sulfotransferase NodH